MAHHHLHHPHDKKKHLRELLREDQEPFLLNKHIADKRCHLKTTTSLQPKKHNLFINQTSSSKHVSFLCRQTCFMSFKDSTEFKKSPFPSPAKSPCKAAATRFLHIPAKTAAMLLEAALRIQSTKPKTQAQNIRFGLFGSFFKRLRNKSKTRKCEICVNDASTSTTKVEENVGVFSTNKVEEISEDTRRVSSAGWSESNEGKSLDMESCSTTSRSDCSSPTSSPFHFALQRTLTPDMLSPVASPVCHSKTDDKHEESLQKIPVAEEAEQDQFSPVSVLDPPFEDDDEQNRGDEEDEEDSDFDVECSYAIVQRAKLKLLHKLRRFERLAELDPVELEKRMLEDQEDDDGDDEEECDYVNELGSSLYMEENLDEIVREVLSRSNQFDQDKIPSDVRRLLLDLIAEERKSESNCRGEAVVSSVCKRLNAWKEVESNTIDMMVELDFRKEVDGWTQCEEEVGERAKDTELAIFELLVAEIVA
ncbi:uncharacterized protein LOC141711836 [Apium graveolens]|uniref:uncharacterized protein LOC141711836 n=1 Tax=Apium graveolens TaxID=4045 RepID=UPI003D7A3742